VRGVHVAVSLANLNGRSETRECRVAVSLATFEVMLRPHKKRWTSRRWRGGIKGACGKGKRIPLPKKDQRLLFTKK
jgi:threonine/homoserine efflux transporter RhtA